MSIRPIARLLARPIVTSSASRLIVKTRFHLFRTASTKSYSSRSKVSQSEDILQSSIGLTTLAATFILSLGGIAAWQSYNTPSTTPVIEPHQESITAESDKTLWIQVYPGMPAQLPPGRPGNLTKDQEAKLRELWEAMMIVCGTWPDSDRESVTSAATSTTHEPDAAKKKKGFGRLLGGKKKEEETSAAEDKHGLDKEYREALASQSPQELRDTMWSFTKADDPDAMLLRFLIARKWNVHDALVMAIATIHWRGKVVHLDDDIMRSGEGGALEISTTGSGTNKKNAEDFLAQLRMGKSFLHGEDKEGRPLCWVRVKLHRGGEQSEVALERYTVYTIETARLMLRPPVDTAVIVFDMTGFSMANMDYTPVKFMIKVFEANYPESLGAVLVHSAPWVFQGIWSVIKGWLDPVVASKVHFTKTAADLSQFINIKDVPKELGGQEDWTYKYIEPVQGENQRVQDTSTRAKLEQEREAIVRDYEAATVRWVKTGEEGLRSQRLQLADRLRQNYWQLDPYVRARSLYDRWGVIKGGGVINFHPSAQSALAMNVMNGSGVNRNSADRRSLYHDAQEDVD